MAKFTVIKDVNAAEGKQIKGYCVYMFELVTRLSGQFDGTKFGVSEQKTLWDRLRSHATSSPLAQGHVVVFKTKDDMIKAENILKGNLPVPELE